MKKKLLMSPEEAVELIKDGDVVATGGFIGTGLPEIISSALEEKYKKWISKGFDSCFCCWTRK